MQHSFADPGQQIEMYRIDGGMIYEVNTALIRLINEPESFIRLSNQASRLLYMLVSHAGIEMERNDLIYRVWEKHGYSGSSVSLNVSVSEIRKAFRELGHDAGLISTLRKKGFCLNARVEQHSSESEPQPVVQTLIAAPHEQHASTALPDETAPVSTALPLATLPPARSPTRTTGLALALLMLCLMVVLLTRWFASNGSASSEVTNARPVPVGVYGQCSLFVLTDDDAHSTDYLPLIQQQLAREQVDCQKNKADVFFTRLSMHLFDNTFMGVCYPEPGSELYSHCVSYKRLEDLPR